MSQGGRRGGNPWLIAIIVTLGAFMEVLDTTIVNVSLPHIAGNLAVSDDESTWAITTYLVANGIVLTISGDLSRRLGRKRYFLICIAGFTATSLACGTAFSFPELLLFRGLQGLFGGGLQPTQQAIILDTFPPEKRQTAFSITAIATIIAPVLGPVIGGWLTDQYSWHWIFLVNIPVGALTFFGVMHQVQDSPDAEEEKKNAPPFDYLGVCFIALALGCMEVGIDRGEDYDWLDSNFVRVMLGLSVFGYLFGIAYLLYARHPVVNLRVFKDKNFALGWTEMGMMGFILYASAVLLPQFAQQQDGYTATWAGYVLAPGAIVLVLLIPVVGQIMKIVPVKYVIAAGGFSLAMALFYSQRLVPDIDFYHLVVYRSMQTAALALLFVPISTAAYATLPQELNGDAAALFSMSRNVFGGVGISVSTALVTDHAQLRQHLMVEHLDGTYQPYNVLLQNLQQGFMTLGQSSQAAMRMAPGETFQMLTGQSAVLAYADVFYITGCLALLMTALAFCLSGGKPKGGGGGAA